MAEETDSGCLPNDIMVDWILIRLPAKDLIRYKRVCKRWCSVISSADFATLHFDYTTSKKPAEELITVHHSYDDLSDELPDSQDPYSSVLSWFRMEILVGSINGLLAVVFLRDEVGLVGVNDLRNDEEVYDIWIWNPATGKSKKLPLGMYNGVTRCRMSSFGFGWDPAAKFYKLVKFVYGDGGSWGEVWSSDSDSWSIIEMDNELLTPSFPSSFHPEKPISSSNVTVKGGSAVCWIFKKDIDYKSADEYGESDEDGKFAVASFDISSEVLKVTPFPELHASLKQLTEDFSNLNGVFGINWKEDFALVERYTSGIPGNYTVWVWDAEEVHWTREATFVLDGFSLGCLDSSKEKLVLLASKRLTLCDMESGVVKFLESSEVGEDYVGEARLYHASLLSLDGFVAREEEWMTSINLEILSLVK